MEIIYIGPDDLNIIIEEIMGLVYADEPPADYVSEREAIDNYFSLIDRVSSDDYYPDIYKKASILYINLITEHVAFFSNGNKRMAMLCRKHLLTQQLHCVQRVEASVHGTDSSRNVREEQNQDYV